MIVDFKSPETKFLSNFTLVDIEYGGIIYPSVEHAYQSAKSFDPNWKKYCENRTIASYEVKIMSHDIKSKVDNWSIIKLDVMEYCLRQKYSKEPFKGLLLATGNQNIQEGNKWHDTFWGVDLSVDPNFGENHLGRLIMKIRDDLRRSN